MRALLGTSPVLAGSAAPLTQARLLAALLARPMPGEELDRWVRRNDGAGAVDALLAAGSVRRTAGGGLALDGRRRSTALDALARDLRL
ncbi:hypothetical protein [Cellulomonas hominis]|uniref:hypothetical protein n=1 Tax=Cellulomonas hominis TaxID=156981 RepID=UPI001B9BE0FB|nr:hypothetical protein [Cellulomonas hominis]VTR77448.1 hypothetical protein CHMI_02217 [Cellulomonas hominis]